MSGLNLNTLGKYIPVLTSALNVIGSFSGGAKEAEIDSTVQSAAKVAGALFPLVDAFTRGNDVTEEDVLFAMRGLDASIMELENTIRMKENAGGKTA